jgi:hypothetical protein
MARKRALATLSRSDSGRHIAFCNDRGHQEGVIRSFSHGVYSRPAFGEVDKPMVMVTLAFHEPEQLVVPFGAHSHWATPETLATITPVSVAVDGTGTETGDE